MSRPHVQVVLADDYIPPNLREAIRRSGASASFRPLAETLRSNQAITADAVVVVVPDDIHEVTRDVRVLLDRLAEHPRATLVLRAAGGLLPEIPHPETVPVTFGCGLDADELTVRLTTMIRMRTSLDCLHRGMTANRHPDESAAKRYLSQLHLASQIQREFLPEALPVLGRVSFSAIFRPVDYVSGDLYDIHRLDEDHVAIALADATGHGIPAALLTVFVKRALRGKEIHDGHYRLIAPDEVLRRLNDELLEANLSECRFVAATYAVLNTQTLELALARGGSPYPVLRRARGELELLQPSGGVIGVMPDADFSVQSVQLEPGDALIICSDGLERVVMPRVPPHGLAEAFTRAAEAVTRWDRSQPELASAWQPVRADAAHSGGEANQAWDGPATATMIEPAVRTAAPPRRNGNGHARARIGGRRATLARTGSQARTSIAPDEALLESTWCATLRDEGPTAAFEQLTVRYEMLRRMGYPLDDLTVLAMRVGN